MSKSKTGKAKRKSMQIAMVSTAGTGHRYYARRNPKEKPEKMELRKYDPVVRKHVIYKEQKMK